MRRSASTGTALRSRALVLLALSSAAGLSLAGCGEASPPGPAAGGTSTGDLPLGQRNPEDTKADGTWGAALDCKPVPALTPLRAPRITISLNGLTLRLSDPATGFEKVYPIGPGAIDKDPTSLTHGESYTYYPALAYGKNDFEIRPSTIQTCKTWHTDPETGQRMPVFAGLPFLSFSGNYAIHGPIDNFRAPNGGTLRRGFVSHGCARMEAADVLEVYALIKGVAKIPVHLQREPERNASGKRVDLAPWIGAECQSDGDCGFAGGFCHWNRFAERGMCSARCTRSCADRAGYPTTFCVADQETPGQGMCVAKVVEQNPDCRFGDHLVVEQRARNGQPQVTAPVCVPGSPGWIGDHCFASEDCRDGTSCAGATDEAPGTCTQACTAVCPDAPGYATTTCVRDDILGSGGACARRCTPISGDASLECPMGSTCVERVRRSAPTQRRFVCAPEA